MPLKACYQSEFIEAGIDEAGRGCYAGPVFAAAVILPDGFYHPLLNDSKQVKEKQRYELRDVIEKQALAWAVAKVEEAEIDRINILQATWKAMHQAIDQLKARPGLLLIDGNRFRPFSGIPHRCIVQGDALYASIAAASILAKTYRDDHMHQLHSAYPHYGWEKNKGYGTKIHRDAILQYGLCEFHRKSFQINPSANTLF
ncbi:ribonuclease HII [Flavihumibacter sp. UBA7668]|uniref:ribonuclease HII n=1 Tax=Flavihumibacter sp. UBA7668 TaxID=1946542 RepID=UPI0025BB208E|nr:ribonuclease HII [Flavihumibacter sp. UBA7668]